MDDNQSKRALGYFSSGNRFGVKNQSQRLLAKVGVRCACAHQVLASGSQWSPAKLVHLSDLIFSLDRGTLNKPSGQVDHQWVTCRNLVMSKLAPMGKN